LVNIERADEVGCIARKGKWVDAGFYYIHTSSDYYATAKC